MIKTEHWEIVKRAGALVMVLGMLFISIVSVTAYSGAELFKEEYDKTQVMDGNVYTDTILVTADIKMENDDELIRTEENGIIKIKILRAFNVNINNCGEAINVRMSSGTVQDALLKAEIILSDTHVVKPSLTTVLTPDIDISVTRVANVKIKADGKTSSYDVNEGTVAKALEYAGIKLGEDDIVKPSLTSAVSHNMEITVQRVTYKEETKTKSIEYKEQTEETSDLLKGDTEIKRYGQEGILEQNIKNTYVDGELSNTEVEGEKVIKEPVHQLTLIGTGEAKPTSPETPDNNVKEPANNSNTEEGIGTFVDYSGSTVSYKTKLVGTATAYTASSGALTASGIPVFYGGVAVNPAIIPLGSRLYIISNDGQYVYGYATAIDTGGALYSGDALVDLFYWSSSECYQFGRRSVTVYVL